MFGEGASDLQDQLLPNAVFDGNAAFLNLSVPVVFFQMEQTEIYVCCSCSRTLV